MNLTDDTQSCAISKKESCLCFLVHSVKQEYPVFKYWDVVSIVATLFNVN